MWIKSVSLVLLPWFLAIAFSLKICISGFYSPLHNFDEIPYAYLAKYSDCDAYSHQEHYQYILDNVPRYKEELANISSAQVLNYGERMAKDAAYFCSNIPFYTNKKLYISSIRAVYSLTSDRLVSLRIVSAFSSTIWYLIVALSVVILVESSNIFKSIILFLFYRLGIQLSILSTPDAMSNLFLTISTLFFLIETHLSLKRNLSNNSLRLIVPSSLFAGFALMVRSSYILPITAFASTIFLTYNTKARVKLIAFLALLVLFCLTFNLFYSRGHYHNQSSYSYFTLIMFHCGKLFGASGRPMADIKNIAINDFVQDIIFYKPFLLNYLNAALEAIRNAAYQLVLYSVALFFASLARLKFSGGLILIIFSTKIRFFVGFFLLSMLYLLQNIMFPLAVPRMIAPYMSIAILLFCFNRLQAPCKRKKLGFLVMFTN